MILFILKVLEYMKNIIYNIFSIYPILSQYRYNSMSLLSHTSTIILIISVFYINTQISTKYMTFFEKCDR
jgi:hypothetical protein